MTSRFVATVGGGSGGGDGGGDGGVENGKGGCGTGTWYGYVVRVRGAGTWCGYVAASVVLAAALERVYGYPLKTVYTVPGTSVRQTAR